MRRLILTLIFGLCSISLNAPAGQSGYILNGKTIITHKDGEALTPKVETPKRQPAAAVKMQGVLAFEEDDLARCYWRVQEAGIYCIRK
jgi:hypothetical protein